MPTASPSITIRASAPPGGPEPEIPFERRSLRSEVLRGLLFPVHRFGPLPTHGSQAPDDNTVEFLTAYHGPRVVASR
jgi:hypothetical protein